MQTGWKVAAWVGLAGLAMVGCGQQSGTTEVAKEETRTTNLEPNKITSEGTPLRVEASDLKVVETVEKASGKVIGMPRLKGTLKLENVGTAQTLRLVRGEVAYIGSDGQSIPLAKDQEAPALKFGGYNSAESLDPGQKNDQTIDVAYPAGAAAAKSVKNIRLHVTYVAAPHMSQKFELPVKMP